MCFIGSDSLYCIVLCCVGLVLFDLVLIVIVLCGMRNCMVLYYITEQMRTALDELLHDKRKQGEGVQREG